MTGDKPSLQRGYPLGALFLLVATSAVLLALPALLLRESKRTDDLLAWIAIAAGVGAVSSMLMGGCLGLFHYSRLRGVALGICVGGLVGLVSGPVLFIAPSAFPHLLLTALGGAVLLVGTATAIRLLNSHAADPTELQTNRPATAAKRHPLDPDPEDEAVQ